MKNFQLKIILVILLATLISSAWAQQNSQTKERAVIITGARFTYPLVQSWIDSYNKINPAAQVIIEARGSADPASYDILIETYEQDEVIRKTRDYAYVAQYPILAVANTKSAFAKTYADKGLNKALFTQLFFHDLYSDKDQEQTIKSPYTIYNRLQKAGVPIVFTHYFGFEQKDIRGKAIAGSDEHLLKALLRDSLAVSYLPLTLIYDHQTGLPVTGLTVLPPDLNGNNRVSDDEKFYSSLSTVISRLGERNSKDIANVPIGSVHLSVAKNNIRPEAISFLQWVIKNGQKDLASFGYLPADGKENSDRFTARRNN